jgi:DNA-binding SARP family transcriptional activator
LIDSDDNFDAIMNNVREQLEKEEIIKPAADVAVKTLKSLDNYKATVNPEEKEITVTWKKPNKISNDLREFKQFSANDQETIKKMWARYAKSLISL